MTVSNLIVRCKRCGEPANLTRKDPNAVGYMCDSCKAIVAARKK